ncbi:hypothetical protein [Rodentibacter myodis]|uniref:hypothetical protein n=1 Tax=Rodentibacter myodis TaxID=1907939 RepID=UPI001FC95AB9|nr:hypothetical protein [Rodentibacter myodis]
MLKEDYSLTGRQYNNWSLRGVQEGMPIMTRKLPDFNKDWKEDSLERNKWSIYKKTVRGVSDL